ncbi:MAG: hypothetical protein K1X88_31110 [Nannocystaceae bacterium]|nr:hypothetical protein [Nannocystaceae bacterium]
MVRGLIVVVGALALGCTADNPAFGADAGGTGGSTGTAGETTRGGTTKGSDSQSTSVSSSDGSTSRGGTADVTGETLPGTTANPETSAGGSTTQGDGTHGDGTGVTTTGVATETGSTGPAFCLANVPGDCGACLTDKCCDPLTFCLMDLDCEALVTCMGGGGSLPDCLTEAGLKVPPDAYADLAGCMSDNCDGNCNTAM